MGIKILIYAWIGLTITLVAIPVSVIVYWLGKKLVNYLYTIVKSLKKDVELHTIKTELQQQKEDFITSSTGNPNDEA